MLDEHSYHTRRRPPVDPAETQRQHGIRVEARQAERAATSPIKAEAVLDAFMTELAFQLCLQEKVRNDRAERRALAEPPGALTFSGSLGLDIRAVPTKSPLGTTYVAEFRQEFEDGSALWRSVHNSAGVITYATAENALLLARRAKRQMEANIS